MRRNRQNGAAAAPFLREVTPPPSLSSPHRRHLSAHEEHHDGSNYAHGYTHGSNEAGGDSSTLHGRRMHDAAALPFAYPSSTLESLAPPLSTSSTPSSMKSAATAHSLPHHARGGWRRRLWDFLFPGEDAAGVEGAAAHYRHKGKSRAHEHPAGSDVYEKDGFYTAWKDNGEDGGDNTEEGDNECVYDDHRSAEVLDPVMGVVQDGMEPWHYMQVPLSRVMLFLRLQQRLADQWMQGWLYAPFFVMLMLFVFAGPCHSSSQTIVDFTATTRDTLAAAPAASAQRESILLEAFRLDTEAVEQKSTNPGNAFLAGNSVRYPWMYSHFNSTINAWTAPPNQSARVDAQVMSIAADHHEPAFLSLTSVRTRRDLLRWLQLQWLPRLWNCKNPDHERPWRSTVTGARYLLGAVRLTSRRYATKETNATDWGESKATWLSELTSELPDQQNAAMATPTVIDKRAAPPDIPSSICGQQDYMSGVNITPKFAFDQNAGGYVALLPFSTSCSAVRAVLTLMETPKQNVLWPPSYNNSLEMRERWLAYAGSQSTGVAPIQTAVRQCTAFIFDATVSEVVVEYVEYSTRTNRYTAVEVSFEMATSGAVVRPKLSTQSLTALRWRFTFTPLALSICLALTILFYGDYLVRRMFAQYATRMARTARPRRTRTQKLWCALLVLLNSQNLVHLLALVLAAAAVGMWWRILGRLTGVSTPRYADRDAYPERISHVVRHAGAELPRLCGGAIFFATVGLVRFASVTPGLWLSIQTIVRSTPRLAVLFAVWLTVTVGVAMMCVLLYGTTVYEFSTFARAYTTLLYMSLDGGRSMMNGFTVARQTGHYAVLPQDDTLPGIRGTRLGHLEPVPLDYRSVILSVSKISIYPLFLLFFYYFQSLVIVVWGTATLVEGYRNVLLLPEAEALPLWRGLWPLQFSSLTRTFNAEFAKETIRRILLSRDEAVMLKDIEYYLRLGCARAPAGPSSTSVAGRQPPHLSRHVRRSRAGDASGSDAALLDGTGDTAVSLTMVLWLLPRELQPEYGAAHLRRLWYLCVASSLAAQRWQQPWKAAQWRHHWDQQPSSLSGWLRASLPEDDTIEEQAARVGMQLEELPNSVVRYVEGKFM